MVAYCFWVSVFCFFAWMLSIKIRISFLFHLLSILGYGIYLLVCLFPSNLNCCHAELCCLHWLLAMVVLMYCYFHILGGKNTILKVSKLSMFDLNALEVLYQTVFMIMLDIKWDTRIYDVYKPTYEIMRWYLPIHMFIFLLRQLIFIW